MACTYCVTSLSDHKRAPDELGIDQMLSLIRILKDHAGIEKVRLTGGEPLLYPNLIKVISGIRDLGITSIGMTSNGQLLARKAKALPEAGLKNVNLSLDSLDQEKFKSLGRVGKLHKTLDGIEKCLKILSDVKKALGVPIITDVHEDTPLNEVSDVVDVLQTPAFLCRQTNFIEAVAKVGLPVNIKKGQFLAPWDMAHVVAKARAAGNDKIMVCERGASFGYNYLISDMRSLIFMKETGGPVVFDATHSVQMPGGGGKVSGGQREFVPALARAAIAVGISGLFMETHPNPEKALSDGPNSWPLKEMKTLLTTLKAIDILPSLLLSTYNYYK